MPTNKITNISNKELNFLRTTHHDRISIFVAPLNIDKLRQVNLRVSKWNIRL
jgi:hypothetical protein